MGALTDAALDRARGALVGLAVGDALGTTAEFQARGSYSHLTEMVGGGPFQLPAGHWTDDTSMAMALADSLLACAGIEEGDLMRRFVRWWREGEYSPTGTCFDVGITTAQALGRFERTGNPLAGSTDPMSAGNGCLMRLSPVAIFYGRAREEAVEAARRQSATTHAAEECLAASGYFSTLLVDAINGGSLDEVIAPAEWPGGGKVESVAAGDWRTKSIDQIRGSGYVIHSLEAALWCVDRARSFEEAVVLAVNLGEDTDTTGAITGQLAGALWGYSAIPARWLRPLAWRERLVTTADQLHRAKDPAV